jgi:tetratricopeptide (TPR) repeat protein
MRAPPPTRCWPPCAPNRPAELLDRAFLAALLDGRADALRLARRLPGNTLGAARPVRGGGGGRPLGAGRAAGARPAPPGRRAGRAAGADRLEPERARARTTRRWRCCGRSPNRGRFRALNALHAALIADIAQRPREAERYARLALADQPDPTLRLALLTASILHRGGRAPEAIRVLDRLAESHDELAIAALEPARAVMLARRGISTPAEGIAEALWPLGSALRGQELEEMSGLLGAAGAAAAAGLRAGAAAAVGRDDRCGAVPGGAGGAGADPAADPLGATAMLRRAGLLDRMERLPEAEALIREVATALPALPQPLMRLGDILRRRGRFAEAAAAYEGAIGRLGQVQAHDWPLLYARGIAAERSGTGRALRRTSWRRCAWRRSSPFVLNYLGYTWADQGVNLAGAGDAGAGGGTAAAGRQHRRQPGLGAVPHRRLGGGHQLAGEGGGAGVAQRHRQRPPRRRVLGRRSGGRGALPVAAGADAGPRAGRCGAHRGEAARGAAAPGARGPPRPERESGHRAGGPAAPVRE